MSKRVVKDEEDGKESELNTKPVFCPECHAEYVDIYKIHIKEGRSVAKRCWSCGSALSIHRSEYFYYAETVVARRKPPKSTSNKYSYREYPETLMFIRSVESMGPEYALKHCVKTNPLIRKAFQPSLFDAIGV